MQEHTPGAAMAPHQRRWRRRVLWGAAGLALAGVLVYGVAPPLARHYGQQILTTTLGRAVSIDAVRFNPFRLAAEVEGVKVMEAGGAAEALGFDVLRVNLEARSLFAGGVVLHEVALAGPRVRLKLDRDGRHSWADVVGRVAALGAADGAEGGKPALFSVGNIRISGGAVTVEDGPRNLTHTLSGLELGVPFISNLPVQVDVFVEPALSAQLNGSPLELKARAKPFHNSHETVVDVALQQFDLAPLLAYVPGELPFRLPSAKLGTDLSVSFRQLPDNGPELILRGMVQLEQVAVHDRRGAPAFALAQAEIEMADVQPLNQRWHFNRVRLSGPEIDVVRLADGGVNLLGLIPPGRKAEGAPAPAAANARPDVLLAMARVRDGVIRFEDRSLATPFRTRVEAINLDLRDLATEGELPAEIQLSYQTDGGEKFSQRDQLRLAPFEYAGQLQFEALQLARYAPYLAAPLPAVEVRGGQLAGSLQYRVAPGSADDGAAAGALELAAEGVALRDFALALKGAKAPALTIPALNLSSATVDLAGQGVRLGTLELKGLALAAVRGKDGELDLVKALMLVPGGKAATAGDKPAAVKGRAAMSARKSPTAASRQAEPAAPEWVIAADKLALVGAALRIEDRTVARRMINTLDKIDFSVEDFSTARGHASQLKLSSVLNGRGRVNAAGALTLQPLKSDLRLDLRDIDLVPLQPYALEEQKIAISRGRLATAGRLQLSTDRQGELHTAFKGNVSVLNFASVDKLNVADFVRWSALRVNGIDLKLAPFALGIQSIALDDLYSRLILNEQGGLNLRELGPAKPAPAVAAGDNSASAPALAAAPDAAPADQAALAASTAPRPLPPPVHVDQATLKRANIAFSDRFIRPNYDANLTDLEGELKGLSSAQDSLATLNVSGKLDGGAPLAISGSLNPFRHDAKLDILATVRDYELTGLSGYSGKYVGLGIARGKLSAELNYKIEERKLSATNQIFLDQLTFGDKVDSPDALNLPVQLAVSLLKNSRGEIDLRLPISGTLDDPQFSIFGLVMKMFFNLIGKAITSPFALLGAVLGGGEELSVLELAPGVARLAQADQDKLGKLAQALTDRPSLRLDVTGRADPAVDADGLRQVALERAVRAQKAKQLIGKGQEAPSVDDIEVSAEEYPELLRRAYRAADFKRPRNMVGLLKDVPVAEMEALMRDSVSVSESELQLLAQQRGQAVRDWMVGKGGVPGERVFLLPPRVESAAAAGEGAGAGSAGRAAVQFSLR